MTRQVPNELDMKRGAPLTGGQGPICSDVKAASNGGSQDTLSEGLLKALQGQHSADEGDGREDGGDVREEEGDRRKVKMGLPVFWQRRRWPTADNGRLCMVRLFVQ